MGAKHDQLESLAASHERYFYLCIYIASSVLSLVSGENTLELSTTSLVVSIIDTHEHDRVKVFSFQGSLTIHPENITIST